MVHETQSNIYKETKEREESEGRVGGRQGWKAGRNKAVTS